MKPCLIALWVLAACLPETAAAAAFGSLRGIVYDPDHRPVPGARIDVRSATSDYSQTILSGADGDFETASLPAGAYRITVAKEGFTSAAREAVVVSGSALTMHLQLSIGTAQQTVDVVETALAAAPDVTTPTTVVGRREIEMTPGAALSNSLNMITDYVPGAWITHDQLHIRGGHQVTWAIDGVSIPNTNIASNVGPQIDPKDIDYLEVQRGGFGADQGDRTYGVFNVLPRTGFERNNEGEIYAAWGAFHQTNEQVNFGSHTGKFAYFASVNGNRSDFGLETPGPEVLHDRSWGFGGMASLIYSRDAANQFRLVTSLRRDDYQIPDSPGEGESGIGDVERERDALVIFSWVHSFRPDVLLTVSPFYHFNRANYDGDPNDVPVDATQHRASEYAGGQVVLSAVTKRHNARAGVYAFGQHDSEALRLMVDNGSGDGFSQARISAGQLEALYLEDQCQALSWLTLTAGVRLTHFSGAVSENAANPRLGGAVRIPGLNWVLSGSWGLYYQAPPLSTVSGPILDYAAAQGLGFIPLKGERDQEHLFGLTIPVRGWSLAVTNYHQRAHNYFDHNAIGNSNVFFPLTIDGARFYGWEVAARSPRLFHRGEVYLAYSLAHALGSGAVSGGLTDFSPPAAGYFLLDHDQHHTLHAGFNFDLPHRLMAGGNLYYGSGFTDGSSYLPAHLPPHATFDISVGRAFGERVSVSLTALNMTNRRFLLDNSTTFGGTHYADPRQVYLQVRYRFHY